MDQRGRVFHFAGGAHHGGLAIGFDLVGGARLAQDLVHQQLAQRGRGFKDLRAQVFLEGQAGPGIADHGGRHDHDQRPLGRLAAFNAGLLDVTDDFSHLQSHSIAPMHA
ncbi:hypothetical protein D3C72_1897060 [compost metagenome]